MVNQKPLNTKIKEHLKTTIKQYQFSIYLHTQISNQKLSK